MMVSEPIEGALPPPPELPLELTAALESAFSQNLGSLDSLRITLRRYVQRQRSRGASLADIDMQMRRIMAEVDGNSDGDGLEVSSELTAQVVKWTKAFFAGPKS